MKEKETKIDKKDFDVWYAKNRSIFFIDEESEKIKLLDRQLLAFKNDEDMSNIGSLDEITNKRKKAEEELFDFAMNCEDCDVISKCYDLFARIMLKQIGELDIILENWPQIVASGFNAYQNKAYREAEGYFTVIAELDIDNNSRNNLAYMIRRGEVIQPQNKLISRALVLLRDGVEVGDSFSLVNTALILAINIGDDNAWNIADKLFSKIEADSVESVISWWASVDEKEGGLVHLWLQRHSLMDDVSVWGTKEVLVKNVTIGFPNIPKWIGEKL